MEYFIVAFKPEDIVIDAKGHLRFVDYDLFKRVRTESKQDQSGYLNEKSNSFVGTPEYLAPEVLRMDSYGYPADWWSIGVMLYEFMVGLPPFYNADVQNMYHQILTEPAKPLLPQLKRVSDKLEANNTHSQEEIEKQVAREVLFDDLVLRMLDKNPITRINDQEIKDHPLFKDVDWVKVSKMDGAVEGGELYAPRIEEDKWDLNFAPEFTSSPTEGMFDEEDHCHDEQPSVRWKDWDWVNPEL